MSFSFDVKCELCAVEVKNSCCKVAMLYGMLLFAQHIGKDEIRVVTENVLVANSLNTLAYDVFGVYFAMEETANGYTLTLKGDVLDSVFDRLYIDVNGKLSLAVSSVITEKSCCVNAFLRGAFMVGGYVSNPENRYHFEISTSYYTLAKSFCGFMRRHDLPARTVVRKSSYVVYFKESEAIERFLYLTGAKTAVFAFMDVKIQKEMNNYSNRVNNTRMHNIEKTINKSVEQVKSINKIAEKIGLDFLEPDLAFAARLRLENPDKSLNELAKLCGGKFSRSGLNRKLARLSEIASKLED